MIYFGLIRPIHKELTSQFFLNIFTSMTEVKENVDIIAHQDDIIVESKEDKFLDVRVSLPFGPYYFLVLFITFSTDNNHLMRWLHVYNISLFIILPLLMLILLSGYHCFAPIMNAHEIAYKALFLSIGMIMCINEYQIKK